MADNASAATTDVKKVDTASTVTDTTKTTATVDQGKTTAQQTDKTVDTGKKTTSDTAKTTAKVDTGTIFDGDLNDDGTEKSAKVAPADWPEDWRERMAGDNKQLLGWLKRHSSPKSLAEGGYTMRQKLSAGDLLPALPEKATPEELTSWREKNGIPTKAEGYLENLPEGVVLGDEDKPIINEFAAAALAENTPPKAFKALIAQYYKLNEKLASEQHEADKNTWRESEDALRAEWGPEFRGKTGRMTRYLDNLPGGLGELLKDARLGDGTKLMGNQKALRWLDGMLSETDPMGTVVGTTGTVGSGPAERLGELQKLMRDQKSEYYVGPNANKLQAEYRNLLDWKARQKAA